MDVQHLFRAIGFLSLETVGIPGNIIILACFFHYRIFNGKFMPVDTMLSNLSFINLEVVLFRGIPQSLASVGINNLFDPQGCHIIIFIYRNLRAMSICVTSLLSCYQLAVIPPSLGFWDTFKSMLSHNLSPIMVSLWCFNLMMPLFSPFTFSEGLAPNSTAHVLNLGYCLVLFPSYTDFILNGLISLVRDLVFIFLMIIFSVHIIIVLYRHRQQVKSIRSYAQDQKVETRATKAVLLLVLTYVVFFGLDNGIWLFTVCTSTNGSAELTYARVVFGSCFCAMTPIVIIATNRKVQHKLMFLSCKTNTVNT